MAGRKDAKDADGLSPLDRRFAVEYLVDLNATDAYIRASLPKKVTRKTAGTNGWKVLQRPEVQALVRKMRDAGIKRAELSVDEVLAQLKHQLFFDARDVFDQKTGALLPMEKWPERAAAAVIGVKDTMAGREIKFTDKASALDKAMRYFGLFEKDNKQQAEAIAEVVFRVVKPGGADA